MTTLRFDQEQQRGSGNERNALLSGCGFGLSHFTFSLALRRVLCHFNRQGHVGVRLKRIRVSPFRNLALTYLPST